MAITEVKIHPAIGVARVGNSPDEWYVGPETADMPPIPPGGYKDGECRVKRQAARFRVFAHHDNGPPTELTAPDATIEWTVKLANTKSALTGADPGEREIRPRQRTVVGPNAADTLSGGTVEFTGAAPLAVDLGEIRTDPDGRLLVLGGRGVSTSPVGAPLGTSGNNGGWHDDVADGSISAQVTIGTTGFTAVGAWVIVAPPNFAPTVRPIVTLYDRLFDFYRTDGMFSIDLPDSISFRFDIHPILDAAVEHRGVRSSAAANHGTLDSSLYPMSTGQKADIVGQLKGEGGNMPLLAGVTLTATQRELMRRWRDDHPSVVDDWSDPAQPLPLTPDELDRGPLWHSVGATFNPGIEAGAFLIGDPNRWAEAFRLDPEVVSPGDVTQRMSCPWQADFWACRGNWWPSHRPGETIMQSTGLSHDWASGTGSMTDMVANWHTLGFVVPQGDDLVEVERCATPSITLLTPILDFVDVPLGPAGVAVSRSLPVHFEVYSPGVAATFRIVSGASTLPFSRFTAADVVVDPTAGAHDDAYVWITYTPEAVGPSATGSAVVEHIESGRQWTIELRGNTVTRQTTEVALVVDRSGSMRETRGDGTSKLIALQEAASLFVDLAHEGDGLGVVEFNSDIQGERAVEQLGSILDPLDSGRVGVKSFIGGLMASGGTSIGDGIERGQALLGLPGAGYVRSAMVVITDGKETSPRWIADVAGSIDATTFGVGIGTAANVDAATLQALTGNHGGYLLVTGPIVGDTELLLMKYFLQILAGLSNAEVLLDPEGHIGLGDEIRIPLTVSDADLMLDVVMLSPAHPLIDVRVETPLGIRLDPSSPETEHVVTGSGEMLRIQLPVEREPGRVDQAGNWTVVLSAPRTDDPDDAECHRAAVEWNQLVGGTKRGTAPYSVVVHVYSDVAFRAELQQASTLPGTRIDVAARLSRAGAPFDGGAGVFAEITPPSGIKHRIDLDAQSDGRFAGSFVADEVGVHRTRVRASGRTAAGWRFEREQTFTAVASRPVPGSIRPQDRDRDQRWCWLVKCGTAATESKRFGMLLRVLGVNQQRLTACIEKFCRHAPDAEAAEVAASTQ